MGSSSRCRRWMKPCRTLLHPSPTDVLKTMTGHSSTFPQTPHRLDFKRKRITRKNIKHRHGTTHQEKEKQEEEKTERRYSPFSHSLGCPDRKGGHLGSCECRGRSRCQKNLKRKDHIFTKEFWTGPKEYKRGGHIYSADGKYRRKA